ncbi:MAG: RecQ family ATP-dependent DNA helicase [Lewinellaceae bacterium]|nr:RecQ family ATP-dependent DNA helicase [Saprospiraceae bacterium]MCB9340855.1 RecQ family ATP-dependent DNA helicase [Lewinellaceae bacterium]
MEPKEILKKYWGFDNFRPLQEDIIQAVLAGYDTLALMPTGGGKSLCFQVPALCKDGICLVISPLIALMKDQVQNLVKRGIPAAAVFSGMHYKEIDRILDNCAYGNIKFLYLSPERLTSELAIERIKKMTVNLLAVDEAHCISQWGYDFRPPYLQIADIREHLPNAPVLALTATATGEVVQDIQVKLAFKNGKVFQKSFARSNLAYVVLYEENKKMKLLEIVRKVGGPGVVYVRNRKLTKETAHFLQQNKIPADYYHAGLAPELRSTKQEAWMLNKTRIMVCTNAFGMGIDKPDVRSVVHLDLPDSLEAYFQEAGRAGRDGKKSYAVLLYAHSDKSALERNFEISFPPIPEIKRVYQALGSYFQQAVGGGAGQSFDFDITDFCQNFKLDLLSTFSCLKILEQEGWIAISEAVYLPSTFMVLVTREQLYDFQLKNPGLDLVAKTLLRVTEGSFSHYVNIQENSVAKFLKMRTEDFIAALQQLDKEGVIDYRLAKDKPQLVFTQHRVDADNLTIDTKQYNFRKERHAYRMGKAIAYADTPRCRSQQLLHYFGEDAEPCGICDVCLGRTKTELSTDDFERYKTKISQLLKAGPLGENQLLEAFATHRHAKVLHAVHFLLEEGFLLRKEDKLAWKG